MPTIPAIPTIPKGLYVDGHVTWVHWVIDHWPFLLSVSSLIITVGIALYMTLKIKIPDLSARVLELEGVLKDTTNVTQLTDAVSRMEHDCMLHRDNCQNTLCLKIDSLKKAIAEMHQEYEMARTTSQKQAVIMARVDERVQLLLRTTSGKGLKKNGG